MTAPRKARYDSSSEEGTNMWGIILIVTIIAFVIWLFGRFAQNKMHQEITSSPEGRSLIQRIESYGVYEGRASSKERVENLLGLASWPRGLPAPPSVVEDCLDRLEAHQVSRRHPLPLMVAYYLSSGFESNLSASRIAFKSTPETRKRAFFMKSLFPPYGYMVETSHRNPNDSEMILCLTFGFIDNIVSY